MNFCSLVLAASLVMGPGDPMPLSVSESPRQGLSPEDVLHSIGIESGAPLWLEIEIQSDIDDLLSAYPSVFTEKPDPREEVLFVADLEKRLDRLGRFLWIDGVEPHLVILGVSWILMMSVFSTSLSHKLRNHFGVENVVIRQWMNSLGPIFFITWIGLGLHDAGTRVMESRLAQVHDLRGQVASFLEGFEGEGGVLILAPPKAQGEVQDGPVSWEGQVDEGE